MLADQFCAQSLDAEPPRPPQIEDQGPFGGEHLASGRVAGATAALDQARIAGGLIAPPPFAQGRSRDAAAPANDAGIADALIEPDPAEPRSQVHPTRPDEVVSTAGSDDLRLFSTGRQAQLAGEPGPVKRCLRTPTG